MLKNIFSILLASLLCTAAGAQVISPALPDAPNAGSWYCFRNTVTLPEDPETIELRIAADSKYWLWIDGRLETIEGGLKRGPNPQDTYCDVLTSLDALHKGKNTVAVLVWYFGKDGFSHRSSPVAGITFDLKVNGRTISPDTKWRAIRHPAFYIPDGESPNYRLSESNIGFDAAKDIPFQRPDYDDSRWPAARELTTAEAGWNRLVDRPIPQWRDYGVKHYERMERHGDSLVCTMPYNAQVMPRIRLRSDAGRRIRIYTDDYRGGSETNVFAEYVTEEGENEFECFGWMNGHQIIYIVPEQVEVLGADYRETGYDTDFAGSFRCDDPRLNRLWEKAQRTLYLTMRDTYMDCPDRERAQWWGDVVNELGEAFYALDERAHLLTRKGIRELMDWQRPDSTIRSPVPGNYPHELPMQMLASVGYYGFWTYYMGSGDRETIEYVFPKVRRYIHVWRTDERGLVIPRKGGWTWGDWGDDKDMELLFSQWYIIALKGYGLMASLVGEAGEAQWAEATADRMRKAFHSTYWNGRYYISPEYTGAPDDRAQALAVLSGTLPKEHYPAMRHFFAEQFHASPYMEKHVLEALCRMGYFQDALDRMKLRFGEMIDSHLTTLWEGWRIGDERFGGGTYNHAWSGGALTVLSSRIAGIEPIEPAFKVFRVAPRPAHLSRIVTEVPLSGCRRITLSLERTADRCVIRLGVPAGTEARLDMPDGYSKCTINGSPRQTAADSLGEGDWIIELTK